MSAVVRFSLVFIFLSSVLFSQTNTVVQNIINQTNLDSLTKFVRELSGVVPTTINGQQVTIASRHKNYIGNDQAANYLMQKLSSYGLQVTNQVFSATGRNILAVQPGTRFPNKKFIICGHYDSMPAGPVAPGADDNASGTAAVIEAARIFSNYSFPYTIVYALWDEEEQGLIGSAYYANLASTAGDSILGVLNMDMIAYDGNNDGKMEIHTRSTANSLMLSTKMIEVNTSYNVNLTFIIKNPGSTYSDHASFWTKNYSAILLIEDNNDFHPQYHTVNDVMSYFNYPYFHKASKLTLGTLALLALNLNIDILHTPFASTSSPNDIVLNASIETSQPIAVGSAAPRLYYRTKQGSTFSSFLPVAGIKQMSTTNWSFTIPAQPQGTTVQYYFAAQDSAASIIATLPTGGSGLNPPGTNPPATFYQFLVANSSLAFSDNASSTSNWTISGLWNTTTSKFVSAPSSFTESPSGNYGNNVTATLTTTTPINLSNAIGASLEFSTQYFTEAGYDYAQVLISTNNGTTWTPLAGRYTKLGAGSYQPANQPLYNGTQSTWVMETMDLTPYIGNNALIRFLFKSDGSVVADGWYVDDISVAIYNIIPVELHSFYAETGNNGITIKWVTAAELNNKGFSLEKSTSANSAWDRISFMDGKGTTNETSVYSFVDRSAVSGTNYYRLRQIDFDGSEKTYGPIEINYSPVLEFALNQNYPNPFNPSTIINWQLPVAGHVSLKVYDMLGSTVAVLVNEIKEAGKYNTEFNSNSAGGLPSGIYFYELRSGKSVSVKKFMLMK